jgi:hypothetical protein
MLPDFSRVDFPGDFVSQLCAGYGVNGEAAESIAQVTPCIDIPVVAVEYDLLRGNMAFASFVAFAIEVPDLELPPAQCGAGNDFKIFQRRDALSRRGSCENVFQLLRRYGRRCRARP